MRVQNCVLFSFLGLQLIFMILLTESPKTALAQESPFELPVQIVGFPVIIFSVRLANFVKKLAYSLNPSTYRRKTRSITDSAELDQLNVAEAEKRLVAEMGENVCIYERICAHYAKKAIEHQTTGRIDWGTILRNYKHSPDRNKEFYLLSVFLGNIVGSPNLCHQLAKRGRACTPLTSWEQ